VDIVKGRMKKMEEQGIIIRYTIAIDYHKIGFELYKSSIYLKSSSKLNEIMKYAEQSDKIINIVKQIAPWDLEFVLFCKSFDDYNKTISKFTEKFKDSIKKVETATMSEDIIFPCNKLPFD
jgi:DNA-binding Lrp family transcriptional regulator